MNHEFTADAEALVNKVEQKVLSTKVEIHGGTLQGGRVKYEPGTIEILPNGMSTYTGFGLEKPLILGSQEVIFAKEEGISNKVNLPTFLTNSDEKLELMPTNETMEDQINMAYASGNKFRYDNLLIYLFSKATKPYEIDKDLGATEEDIDKLVHDFREKTSKLSDDTVDKLIVASCFDYTDAYVDKFLALRPDLIEEVFKFMCREFILERGHSKFHRLYMYLTARPELKKYLPQEYKVTFTAALLGLFHHLWATSKYGMNRKPLEHNADYFKRANNVLQDFNSAIKDFDIDIDASPVVRKSYDEMHFKLQELVAGR